MFDEEELYIAIFKDDMTKSTTMLITFGLACIVCCAIAFGLIIAIIAGIAYGYNYSMAEFITYSRSDVTVFMRRGQFYDKSSHVLRRSGADDFFATNSSSDYEDQKAPAETKQLADKWLKTQDTRRYAEVLTKYNTGKDELRESEIQEPMSNVVLESQEHNVAPKSPIQIIYLKPSPPPAVKITSIVPNPPIRTMSWQSGSSQIMMRNFEPSQELKEFTALNKHMKPLPLFSIRSTKPQSISILGSKENSMSNDMREWTAASEVIPTDELEDVDDDNIVYKPV